MDKGECNFRQGIGRLKTQIFVRKHATFESDKLHQSPWPRVVVPQKFIRPRYQMKSGVHNPCYLRENWPWFDVINQKKTAMKIILFCTWKFNHSQECKIVRFFAKNHCVFVLRRSRVFCVFIPFSPRFLKHHLHHGYTEKSTTTQGHKIFENPYFRAKLQLSSAKYLLKSLIK